MECRDSIERPARPNQKGKKDYLPLPFLGMEVGGDGRGLFWLMMEGGKREKGRISGLKFFLPWVGGDDGRGRPDSQQKLATKRFWVVTLNFFFAGAGKERAWGLCGAGCWGWGFCVCRLRRRGW